MKLHFLNGIKEGGEFILQAEETTLGRELDNDINLLVEGVSRYHAKIIKSGDKWTLKDLGSTNGSKVNGEKITETELRQGDKITLGDQDIRFGDPVLTAVDRENADNTSPTLGPVEPATIKPIEDVTTRGVIIRPVEEDDKPAPALTSKAKTPARPIIEFMPSDQEENKPDSETSPPKPEEQDPPKPVFEPLEDTGAVSLPSPPKQEKPSFEPVAPEPEKEPVVFEPKEKSQTESQVKPERMDRTMTMEEAGRSQNKTDQTRSFLASFSQSDGDADGPPPAIDDDVFKKLNLFGGEAEKIDVPGKKNGKAKDGKKLHLNMVFYVALFAAAIIFVAIFIKMQHGAPPVQEKTTAKKQVAPFLLNYEKNIYSKKNDNIFRFYANIENGMATFVVDDIRSGRHYRLVKKVEKENLQDLESKIKQTDFMKLKSNTNNAKTNDTIRTLTVSSNLDLNTVKVDDAYASVSFEEVEHAIEDLASVYGIRTISLTPEELKREAMKSFDKAESLFANRDGNPANLRNAISRYQLVIDYLKQFTPKPDEWKIAQEHKREAENMLKTRLEELQFDFVRNKKLGNYAEARDACAKIMETASPENPIYEKARNSKIKIERQLSKRK